MSHLARWFAALVLAYDRRQLYKGKAAPVRGWAVKIMVSNQRRLSQ